MLGVRVSILLASLLGSGNAWLTFYKKDCSIPSYLDAYTDVINVPDGNTCVPFLGTPDPWVSAFDPIVSGSRGYTMTVTAGISAIQESYDNVCGLLSPTGSSWSTLTYTCGYLTDTTSSTCVNKYYTPICGVTSSGSIPSYCTAPTLANLHNGRKAVSQSDTSNYITFSSLNQIPDIVLDLTGGSNYKASSSGYNVQSTTVGFVVTSGSYYPYYAYPAPTSIQVFMASSQTATGSALTLVGTYPGDLCVGSAVSGTACLSSSPGDPTQCCAVGTKCISGTCMDPIALGSQRYEVNIPLSAAATGVKNLFVRPSYATGAAGFALDEISVCLSETYSWQPASAWGPCTGATPCSGSNGATPGTSTRLQRCRGAQSLDWFPDSSCSGAPGSTTQTCYYLDSDASTCTSPIPGAPTNVMASPGYYGFQITWSDTFTGPIGGYIITRSGPSTLTSTITVPYPMDTPGSYWFAIPGAGTEQYQFTVTTISQQSVYSAPSAATTLAAVAPQVAPTISSVASNDRQLVVAFIPVSPPPYGVIGFDIQISTCPGNLVVNVIRTTSYSQVISGLTNGVGYEVQIRTVTNASATPWSGYAYNPNINGGPYYYCQYPLASVQWQVQQCTGKCGQGAIAQRGNYVNLKCETTDTTPVVLPVSFPCQSLDTTCTQQCPVAPTVSGATPYHGGVQVMFTPTADFNTTFGVNYKLIYYLAYTTPGNAYGISNGTQTNVYISGLTDNTYTVKVFAALRNIANYNDVIYTELSAPSSSVTVSSSLACYYNCQHGGVCYLGVCQCPRGYTGNLNNNQLQCENPTLSIVINSNVLNTQIDLTKNSPYYVPDYYLSPMTTLDTNPVEVLIFPASECPDLTQVCIPALWLARAPSGNTASVNFQGYGWDGSMEKNCTSDYCLPYGVFNVLYWGGSLLQNSTTVTISRNAVFCQTNPCANKANTVCNYDSCDCVAGYTPAGVCNVNSGLCYPGQCGLYGTCAPDTGLCTCDPSFGFTGKYCQYGPKCNLRCNNDGSIYTTVGTNGICVNDAYSTCSCNGNWAGKNCDTCGLSCTNGGWADSTCSYCTCPRFWRGYACQSRYFEVNIFFNINPSITLASETTTTRFLDVVSDELNALSVLSSYFGNSILAKTATASGSRTKVGLQVQGTDVATFVEIWTTTVSDWLQEGGNQPISQLYFLSRADNTTENPNVVDAARTAALSAAPSATFFVAIISALVAAIIL